MPSLTLFDRMRVWAAVTGLLLAVVCFGALAMRVALPQVLPMLVVAIGGFELFLFAQDLWLKRVER